MENDFLFTLIKSLSKSEKGYIKKQSFQKSGEKTPNSYIQLFNAIDKLATYDEKILLQKLKNKTLATQLPVFKSYLYKFILKRLRNYHEKNNIDIQMYALLSEINILYERDLNRQAEKLVRKLRALSIKYDDSFILLEVIDWERKLASRNMYKNWYKKDISYYHNCTLATLHQVKKISSYKLNKENTYRIIYFTSDLKKQRQQLQCLSNELDALYQKSTKAEKSFEEMLLYNHIKSTQTGRIESDDSTLFNEQLVVLLEANPHFIFKNPQNYIVSLFNLLISKTKTLNLAQLQPILQKIKSIEHTYKNALSNANKVSIFAFIGVAETHLYAEKGDFKSGVEFLDEWLFSKLKVYEKNISLIDKTIIYFNVSYLYFGIADYKNALYWNNKVLNGETSSAIKDMIGSSKILNILIHYELGNHMLLPSLIRNITSFYKKNNLSVTTIPEITKVLTTVVKEGNNQKKIVLKKGKERLTKNLERYPEDVILNNISIICWIDSKIQNRPFAEVVREKAGLMN